MAVFHIVDDNVVSDQDFAANAPAIADHLARRLQGEIRPLSIARGLDLAGTAPPAPEDQIGFTPIGLGLPLTVAIRHVYTGKFPTRGMFGHRGDMAIVSGVRNFAAFNATARAVNFCETGVAPNSHFSAPTTFSQGTPIILYSPAVTDIAVTITFEMAVADTFARDLLDKLASAFTSLAGLPVLLPYAGYLLGGSSLIKLGEGVADALYQTNPPFIRTEVLNFNLPGAAPARADWRIICNPSFDPTKFRYVDGTGLVDGAGSYAGDEPYVVVSLDGAPNDDLKGFQPTVASAAILQKFFSAADGAETAIDTLVGAVGLYSDMKYRQDADRYQQEIAAAPDQATKDALTKKRQAAIANIVSPALKPQQ